MRKIVASAPLVMKDQITPEEREAYRLLLEATQKLKEAQRKAARRKKRRERKGKGGGS